MPRYVFDTYNSVVTLDDEGMGLPDLDAVRAEIRHTLASMMKDEKDGPPTAQLRADVRDESGKRIVTATLLMPIEATK